jgi:hypothetical protein
MILYYVSYLKPHVVAKKLGITTSALRMRRLRGSEDIDYIVNGKGRVMYLADSLEKHIDTFFTPQKVGKSNPSVTRSDAFGRFEDQEQPNKNNTKTKHEALTKDHRYMHSIGKINQKRIDDKVKRLREQKQREEERRIHYSRTKHQEPIRKEREYVKWVHPNSLGNYWNSIEDYEKSKKKKSTEPFY